MKKKYLKLFSLLCALILLSACQKLALESNSEVAIPDNVSAKSENQCRLTFAIDWGGAANWFYYNEKGLADEWRLDLGSGIPEVISMEYNNNNQLSGARWHFDGELIGTITFEWNNKQIATEHWDIGGYLFNNTNTYNTRGQLVQRETNDGYLTRYDYTPEGNHLRDVIYFEGEPIQSDEYSYNHPNKNPYRAIQGLPYLFLYLNPIQSKWAATSDKFTVFENGSPTVLLNIDPSKTSMQTTQQDYLSSATYFDELSQGYLLKNFEYENCGPASSLKKGRTAPTLAEIFLKGNKAFKPAQLRIGTPEQMRRQINRMKKRAIEMKANNK
jgi:YD repeat-containing protein